MINLIIGQNAIGKSTYLKKLYREIGFARCTTNLYGDLLPEDNTPFNEHRLSVVRDICDCDDVRAEGTSYVNIINSDPTFTRQFRDLVSIICRDKEYLLLDEPDLGITYYEEGKLLKLIAYTCKSFKDIYIITHNENFFALPDYEAKTVVTKGNLSDLVTVQEGTEFEVID